VIFVTKTPIQSSSIKLHNIKKTFITPAGAFDALKGIDLTVAEGEFVAIIGKSGSHSPREKRATRMVRLNSPNSEKWCCCVVTFATTERVFVGDGVVVTVVATQNKKVRIGIEVTPEITAVVIK
jgi:ABC-type microcin C transport system duplicated ATPase subunit YejF